MADPLIKPDPDTKGASPSPFADDDIYEDAGDLEFNQDPAWQTLYLARVPKDLWKAWSKLDDDAEIQLGTIRMTNVKKPDGSLDVWQLLVQKIVLLIQMVAKPVHAAKI
jgi:transcription initiation factor TFIIF subunit beta